MEPNLPPPQFEQGKTPEAFPTPTIEQAPVLPSPERPAFEGENKEVVSASAAAAVDAAATPVLPMPVVSQPQQDDNSVTVTDTPSVAADEDLIEKEWVDKAKKIIASTRDDPYRREEAVTQLQKEYLRKRYGKELGAAE